MLGERIDQSISGVHWGTDSSLPKPACLLPRLPATLSQPKEPRHRFLTCLKLTELAHCDCGEQRPLGPAPLAPDIKEFMAEGSGSSSECSIGTGV